MSRREGVSCRLVGPGLLEIATGETLAVYRLAEIRCGPELVGYRLTRADHGGKGRTYDVWPGQDGECDCPDAYHRRRECKHAWAVRRLLGVD
jgi:hypothetical protein